MGWVLTMRNLGQYVREAGRGQTYNAPFGSKDRSRFLQAMDRLVSV